MVTYSAIGTTASLSVLDTFYQYNLALAQIACMELTEPRSFSIPDTQDSSNSDWYGLTTLAGFSMEPGINAHCHHSPEATISVVSGPCLKKQLSKRRTPVPSNVVIGRRFILYIDCFDDQWSLLDLAQRGSFPVLMRACEETTGFGGGRQGYSKSVRLARTQKMDVSLGFLDKYLRWSRC
ncbi:Serine/threonine protein kinase [Fusarium oxysporum f. sp. albedinis]|nr:Serine/threonine protein kinase [Fusarium oxysporum f. sp. albedinis]